MGEAQEANGEASGIALMAYQVWRQETTRSGWESHEKWRYRWRWVARFLAWWWRSAGYTDYRAVPEGSSPYDAGRRRFRFGFL
jgi:hypothetical protein